MNKTEIRAFVAGGAVAAIIVLLFALPVRLLVTTGVDLVWLAACMVAAAATRVIGWWLAR